MYQTLDELVSSEICLHYIYHYQIHQKNIEPYIIGKFVHCLATKITISNINTK